MKQFIAKYLIDTNEVTRKQNPAQRTTLQFFQRYDDVMLCGMNEVLELLKHHTKNSRYTIKYLPEGTIINAFDIVLELEGPYEEFGMYEGMIDGILARQSSLATNAYRSKRAANGKRVVFMGDRADHYSNQERDGYAVSVGGVNVQVTQAQAALHNGEVVGTMPHALIQMFDGDIVKALSAYAETFPERPLTALIDFNNNVIEDGLKALSAFGARLSAVRVDTSPNMVDEMFDNKTAKHHGVNHDQIVRLREELDKHNGAHVKIIVSSGFDYSRIADFEKSKTPVDIYGVGAAMLKVWINFTADAVKYNGNPIAKKGRGYRQMHNYSIL